MDIKQEFREFLNESPNTLDDISGLSSKLRFREYMISKFDKLDKNKGKKLFNDYLYIISDNIFFLYKKDLTLYLFIEFKTNKKTFIVSVIENVSNEKNLSFKVYRAILDKLNYSEIITGDALSIQNLNAHKKAFDSFKIFMRDTNANKDIEIEDKEQITFYYNRNRNNEVFVLKESGVLNSLREMYNMSLDEYLDHIDKKPSKYS